MKKYKLNILGDRKISEREMKDKLKLTLEKCANIGSKQGAIKMMHRVRRLRDEGFLIFIEKNGMDKLLTKATANKFMREVTLN